MQAQGGYCKVFGCLGNDDRLLQTSATSRQLYVFWCQANVDSRLALAVLRSELQDLAGKLCLCAYS